MLAGFFCPCSNPGLCLCKKLAETPLRCQCKDRWCHLTHKNPDPFSFRAELWAVFGIWRWFHKARWWEQVQWYIWWLLKRRNCQMCLKLPLVTKNKLFKTQLHHFLTCSTNSALLLRLLFRNPSGSTTESATNHFTKNRKTRTFRRIHQCLQWLKGENRCENQKRGCGEERLAFKHGGICMNLMYLCRSEAYCHF